MDSKDSRGKNCFLKQNTSSVPKTSKRKLKASKIYLSENLQVETVWNLPRRYQKDWLWRCMDNLGTCYCEGVTGFVTFSSLDDL